MHQASLSSQSNPPGQAWDVFCHALYHCQHAGQRNSTSRGSPSKLFFMLPHLISEEMTKLKEIFQIKIDFF